MRKILLAIFIILAVAPVFSRETGAVRGVVRGLIIKNGKLYYTRIAGATVEVEFTKYRTVTDTDGRFKLMGLPPGEFSLLIRISDGDPILKSVKIETGHTHNLHSIPVYLGPDAEIPKIEPGSMVVSFVSSKDHDEKNAGFTGSKDTPQNGLVFYRPGSGNAYLEIITDYQPTWLEADAEGRYLLVAAKDMGLVIMDLAKPETTRVFSLSANLAEIRPGNDGKIFYISYYSPEKTGILAVDPALDKPLKSYDPGLRGLFVSSRPAEDENRIYAVLSLVDRGKIAVMDLADGTLTALKTVGKLPMDILYLKSSKTLAVINHLGKNMAFVNPEDLNVKSLTYFDDNPGRMAQDKEGERIFVTIPRQNKVLIVETVMGKVIGSINVGTDPFEIKRYGNNLYIVNRQSRNVSVVNPDTSDFIINTPSEDYTSARGVVIIPPGPVDMK